MKKEWTIIGVLGAAVVVVFLCLGFLVLVKIDGQPTPTSTKIAQPAPTTPPLQPTRTAVPPGTNTPRATETPLPTFTPTDTPKPTETPKPTFTPTNTPKPTNTLPPTKTPAPPTFKGKGDSVVNFNNFYSVAIVHITGNAESSFFAVSNYGSDGKQIDLLVNTTEPYDGVRPLDFRNDEHTTRFQVQSSGNWTIQVFPLTGAVQLNVPGTIKGRGDDVLILTGKTPDLAKIRGNTRKDFFAVTGYADRAYLLVNTLSLYEGTVILDPETVAIEVQATGDWTIELTNR